MPPSTLPTNKADEDNDSDSDSASLPAEDLGANDKSDQPTLCHLVIIGVWVILHPIGPHKIYSTTTLDQQTGVERSEPGSKFLLPMPTLLSKPGD